MNGQTVWINLIDYTPAELSVYGLGCLLWVIAYGIYIKNIVKLKYVEMPVFAGCCDVGWEFTWSFLAYNNMGMLFQGANVVWVLLDLGFIFSVGVIGYGWKQFTSPRLQKKPFYPLMCLFIATFAAAATYFLHTQGMDNEVGGRSAFLIQLSISFLYVPLMLRQANLENFSYAANWLRALGSALVVVFFYMHYPEDHFLQLIGTVAAIVDGVFLYLFTEKRRQLRAGVSPEVSAQAA